MEDDDLFEKATLPAIPQVKTVMLVNNFVANTVDFMNLFAATCEDKLTGVSRRLSDVELALALLEAKLDSVPDVSGVKAAEPQGAPSPGTSSSPGAQAAPPPATAEQPSTGEAAADAKPDSEVVPMSTTQEDPGVPEEEVDSGLVPVREHPAYRPYFRLQKIGVPDGQIKLKMQADGLDPDLIEDPEKLIEKPADE